MSDLIELKLVTEGKSESLHRLQVEAFMPLYEKYQDDDTSPAKESLKIQIFTLLCFMEKKLEV